MRLASIYPGLRRNLAHTGNLIDDLLNFALIGRRPLAKQPVLLWDLVRFVTHELPHSPAVVYEVSPDELGTVKADPALLKQVITNLLGNALRFSRNADPPRIQIGCERRGDAVAYFVRDNGVGFDPQHAGKLFGVFERLHTGVTAGRCGPTPRPVAVLPSSLRCLRCTGQRREMCMRSEWVAQIVRYWFEELQPDAWFRRDERVDAAIRERFGVLYEELAQTRPEQLATALECAAAVIVLDQFPRNMFRGTPRAFATDALALAIAQRAIAAGLDEQLTRQQRLFLYMPFQHSEDRAVQARSIELFTQLGERDNLDYAHRHKEVIDRFGRFPHRNEVLGRTSTPEELQFIATHRGF